MKTQVKVAQKDGEITISHRTPEPQVYKVEGGVVTVDDKDLDHFLHSVAGSSVDGPTSIESTPVVPDKPAKAGD